MLNPTPRISCVHVKETDLVVGFGRAECVMLNKGPYILQAVASLDDILRREACHRRKNQSVLHPLQNLGI